MKNIDDTQERNELLIWLPQLMNKKLNSLTIEQLRILHYILGYDSKEASPISLIEEFEGYGYTQNVAAEIVNILKRDNYLIIEKPY